MIKVFLLALALAVSLVGPAGAGPLEDGLAAYQKGDYATALKFWQPLADQGTAVAQYGLGVMYEAGQGVPKDHVQAAFWHRKAADQGHADAQYTLGFMYEGGQGVPKSAAQALFWYRKAADQGYAKGQHALGNIYYRGESVPQDYIQAHMWMNLAVSRYTDSDFGFRASAVERRDEIAAKMTPGQIAEAQRLASAWKPK